jgi:hypothetical protein
MNGLRHTPEINGVVYSWSNLIVNIAGAEITGITKVNYSDEQEIESVYGAGQRPIGRGYGRITSSANITLYRDEVEVIRGASPTGRLQDIDSFDIIVQFVPVGGKAIITHRIRGAQFKSDGVDVSEGDTSNTVDFDLIVSQIEWS